MSARVEGLDRLKRRIREVGASMHQGAEDAQREGAEIMAREWRQEAPVRTGAYKRSIRSDDESAFTDIEYAKFVEFGTSTHVANPAGSRAAATAQRKISAAVARRMRKAVR